MFTIGDFARHGRVSVRMLRHYDAIGLLRPAHVDASSGYRSYQAAQLSRLNRIVALKDLGFTLQQVQTILDEDIGIEELRGMLRLRRAELEAALAEAMSGLARVEARLRMIENEDSMPQEDIVIRKLPPIRLAELSATATSFDPDETGPLIGRLFDELRRRLDSAAVAAGGPRTVYFETPDEDDYRIIVHVGLPVSAGVTEAAGLRIVSLPAVDRAATIVHRGMEHGFLRTSQLLVRWVEAHGYRFDGHAREITLNSSEDPDESVAELQAPIVTT
ncbi:MerR family transcriptional regulator [Nocardia cerradoensis]|uniref:Multidrug-efflux transporter 1 regulator n=1 Tax=Nocardia cerradoensis TaxID=85688 RepID=A0A231GY90_9NOCA|nr:MerR family transcriptional regulator [Nocardia cerradoensis]NKY43301.1 MerR family transcriptional regulator [Nocardia cerradoensis]OXR41593.1 Multidrug-efflux transporter 1 regulator [Nocardia cerradoensis]